MHTGFKASCFTFLAALLLAIALAFVPSLASTSRAATDGATKVQNNYQRESLQRSRAQGKVIVISLSGQWLYAYQDGRLVHSAAVMTGRPSLQTPTGTYQVFNKESPTTFYSPWPEGSPNWYPPTHINYALEWKPGGYYLHDAWWHSAYGPGTNGWHNDPRFGWQWGSHGCIAMALGDAAWLYNWTPIGTTVQINP